MRALKPPPGFITLAEGAVKFETPFNVIGVCVDHMVPAKSMGRDYTVKFSLHDPSWDYDQGMNFRFFSPSIDELPHICANGDVVILRNVIIKEYNHQKFGGSNSTTTWAVLPGSTIVEPDWPDGFDIDFTTSRTSYGRAPIPAVGELKYVKKIVELEDRSSYKPPPKSTTLQINNIIKESGGVPPQRSGKWQLIKDLSGSGRPAVNNFADIFGEVRKLWYNDYGRVSLWLTDYTTNMLLYDYSEKSQSHDGDPYNHARASHDRWPGPWGRMTLSVLLYDAHATFAMKSVEPGMYVLVRNCHIKLDPNGSQLEAVCRGNRSDTTKVNVQIYKPSSARTDERFEELQRRKLEYQKYAKTKGLRFILPGEVQQDTKKRSLETIEFTETNNGASAEPRKKESKSVRRKRLKAEAEAEALKQNQTSNQNFTSKPLSVPSNKYVRCQNIPIPLTPISSILDPTTLQRTTANGNPYILPFQNCSYKLKVRVVDYYPHDLVHFSVPCLVSDYDTVPDADNGGEATTEPDFTSTLASAQSNPHTVRWEWRFFIVVEDAGPGSSTSLSTSHDGTKAQRPQMALLVAGADAEYLLDAEATDLHSHPRQLAFLKEKMFVLWGDLQERKEEATKAGANGEVNKNSAGGEMTDKKDEGVRTRSTPFECFVSEYGVPLPVSNRESDTAMEVDGRDQDGVQYQRMFRLFGTSI